jgi:hypothetical protein
MQFMERDAQDFWLALQLLKVLKITELHVFASSTKRYGCSVDFHVLHMHLRNQNKLPSLSTKHPIGGK